MRKLLLALFATPLFSVAQTSTYFPFPVDSATWSVEYWDVTPPFGYDCWNTWHYGINGDTMIGSNTYHKIYQTNVQYNVLIDTIYNSSNAVYVSAFREDSMKRIWAIGSWDTIERLLYDFSVNVGDTVYVDYFWQSAVVDSIDSVLINNSYRKTILLHDQNWSTHEWIEGIGSMDGLLSWQMVSSFSERLICHSQHDQLYYSVYTYCHCDHNLNGVAEQEEEHLNIYPSPSNGGFEVDNVVGAMRLEMFDASGRLVKQQEIADHLYVDCAQLPDGIYFIRLIGEDDRRIVLKWIKSSQ